MHVTCLKQAVWHFSEFNTPSKANPLLLTPLNFSCSVWFEKLSLYMYIVSNFGSSYIVRSNPLGLTLNSLKYACRQALEHASCQVKEGRETKCEYIFCCSVVKSTFSCFVPKTLNSEPGHAALQVRSISR